VKQHKVYMTKYKVGDVVRLRRHASGYTFLGIVARLNRYGEPVLRWRRQDGVDRGKYLTAPRMLGRAITIDHAHTPTKAEAARLREMLEADD